MNQGSDGPLSSCRVLDLTDEKGLFCGKMLADLGADVIKIEPPGGDPCKNMGPFYHDIPDPEKSLYWLSFNTGKRGITLNIEVSDGREIFRQLVEKADIVIESYAPGYLDSLGLGYSTLSQINPGLILTSISPFGETGPYKDFKASDIAVMALSGYMSLSGDPDRPPVRVSSPIAYCFGAAGAAAGTMIAYYYRELTGEGQWVDASAQQAVTFALLNSRMHWDLNRVELKRAGPYREGLSAQGKQLINFRCKDGYVNFVMFGGKTGAKTNRGLTQWMESEGMGSDFMNKIDWDSFDMAKVSQDDFCGFERDIGQFFLTRTKAELYEEGSRRGVTIYPVSTIKDVFEDPQLKARDFWQEVEHPELHATFLYPGPFVKCSQTPLRPPSRAPRIGEHNREIYQNELGMSAEELVMLKQAKAI